MERINSGARYDFLDSMRGLLLLGMIVYHFFWDLVYLFQVELPWFQSAACYWWQQSFCWLFIFLSGFCWPLGRRPVKRGLHVIAGGVLVAVITHVFVPEQAVVFGILFFLGSAMLMLAAVEGWVAKVRPGWGLFANAALFVLTRNINDGYIGFEQWNMARLPAVLYKNKLTTYLGFTEAGFASSDYFSLFPWLFLYLAGYYAFRISARQGRLPDAFGRGNACLSCCGRHSLAVYLLHQPLLYLLLILALR